MYVQREREKKWECNVYRELREEAVRMKHKEKKI